MNLNHFYHYYKSKSGGVSNLLLGSEELGSTGVGRWNQDLMNAVNADQVNNPSGTEQTADQLDFQASKSAKIRQDVTLVAGTEYTFSVWARAASGTQPFRLRYYDNVGGSGGAGAFTASATWSPTTGRYSFTFTAANSGTFTMMIQNAADAVSRRIYFWGAMLNVGATAADYIKTTFTGPSSPATPLMEFGDNFAGVTAYYSLRRFTIGEDNNAIRVRRSSDDTEQDIGFDSNGDLDSTALLAFVGTGGTDNGFVTTFYDQTGNGNDATNATESEQPLVVSAGTLVEENSKAAVQFDGVDNGLQSAAINTSFTNVSSFVVKKNEAASGVRSVVRIRPNGAVGTLDGISYEQIGGGSAYGPNTLFEANGNAIQNPSGQGTSVIVQELSTLLFEQSQILAYRDGSLDQTISNVSTGTAPIGTCSVNQPLWIGYNFDSNDRAFDGKFQEIILFTSDQSSNRTGIEGNINDHFDIYTP